MVGKIRWGILATGWIADLFVKNFARFEDHVEAEVRAASPMIRVAAE